jgi:hypothetical protein
LSSMYNFSVPFFTCTTQPQHREQVTAAKCPEH